MNNKYIGIKNEIKLNQIINNVHNIYVINWD